MTRPRTTRSVALRRFSTMLDEDADRDQVDDRGDDEPRQPTRLKPISTKTPATTTSEPTSA